MQCTRKVARSRIGSIKSCASYNRDLTITLWYRDQNNPRGCTGVVSLDFNWNFPRYKRVHREHVTKHNRKRGVHLFE